MIDLAIKIKPKIQKEGTMKLLPLSQFARNFDRKQVFLKEKAPEKVEPEPSQEIEKDFFLSEEQINQLKPVVTQLWNSIYEEYDRRNLSGYYQGCFIEAMDKLLNALSAQNYGVGQIMHLLIRTGLKSYVKTQSNDAISFDGYLGIVRISEIVFALSHSKRKFTGEEVKHLMAVATISNDAEYVIKQFLKYWTNRLERAGIMAIFEQARRDPALIAYRKKFSVSKTEPTAVVEEKSTPIQKAWDLPDKPDMYQYLGFWEHLKITDKRVVRRIFFERAKPMERFLWTLLDLLEKENQLRLRYNELVDSFNKNNSAFSEAELLAEAESLLDLREAILVIYRKYNDSVIYEKHGIELPEQQIGEAIYELAFSLTGKKEEGKVIQLAGFVKNDVEAANRAAEELRSGKLAETVINLEKLGKGKKEE